MTRIDHQDSWFMQTWIIPGFIKYLVLMVYFVWLIGRSFVDVWIDDLRRR